MIFFNHIYALLELYPNERWDPFGLLFNPNIKLKYIPLKELSSLILAFTVSIPFLPFLFFSYLYEVFILKIKYKPTICPKKTYENQSMWELSRNPYLTATEIHQNPTKDWFFYAISSNPFTKYAPLRQEKLVRHYYQKWKIHIKNKKARYEKMRIIYNLVVHELTLRKRDHDYNIKTNLLLC